MRVRGELFIPNICRALGKFSEEGDRAGDSG